MQRLLTTLFIILFTANAAYAGDIHIPILTYHNFEPVKPGIVTISTARFEEQMQYIKEHGYTIIPLKEAVAYLQGKKKSLPAKPVVITIDDGRITVYQYLLPIAKKYKIPVTLFIYPSITSHESYAMTWEQIKELQKTGLFDIQSHTFTHPDFNEDQQQMTPAAFQQSVKMELVDSKKILEDKLGIKVTLLAWPFGNHNAYVEQQAKKAGYIMAFKVDEDCASRSDNLMMVPRYMVLPKHTMQTFDEMLKCEYVPLSKEKKN